MSERPPSLPPEEDFSFVRDAEAVEFSETWTPEAAKRIADLFNQVGWPAGIVGSEKSAQPIVDAFLAASKESEDVIEEKMRLTHDPETARKYARGAMSWPFGEFCDIRDSLAASRKLSGRISQPNEVGPVLLRMKKILGK